MNDLLDKIEQKDSEMNEIQHSISVLHNSVKTIFNPNSLDFAIISMNNFCFKLSYNFFTMKINLNNFRSEISVSFEHLFSANELISETILNIHTLFIKYQSLFFQLNNLNLSLINLNEQKNKILSNIQQYKYNTIINYFNKPLKEKNIDINSKMFFLVLKKKENQRIPTYDIDYENLNIRIEKMTFNNAFSLYRHKMFILQSNYSDINDENFNKIMYKKFKSFFNFDYSNNQYKNKLVNIYYYKKDLNNTDSVYFKFDDIKDLLFHCSELSLLDFLQLRSDNNRFQQFEILFEKIELEKKLINF